VSRADIASAVFFVEKRRGKIKEVDPISLLHIFMNLSILHFLHRNWYRALRLFMIDSHKIQYVIEFMFYAQGQSDAFRRGK
jgi:hypothetical protein